MYYPFINKLLFCSHIEFAKFRYNYLAEVEEELSQPAVEVSIFNNAVMHGSVGASATVNITAGWPTLSN